MLAATQLAAFGASFGPAVTQVLADLRMAQAFLGLVLRRSTNIYVAMTEFPTLETPPQDPAVIVDDVVNSTMLYRLRQLLAEEGLPAIEAVPIPTNPRPADYILTQPPRNIGHYLTEQGSQLVARIQTLVSRLAGPRLIKAHQQDQDAGWVSPLPLPPPPVSPPPVSPSPVPSPASPPASPPTLPPTTTVHLKAPKYESTRAQTAMLIGILLVSGSALFLSIKAYQQDSPRRRR